MLSDLKFRARPAGRGRASLLAVFVALNLAAMLSACGGGGAASAEAPEQAPPAQARPAVPTAVGAVIGARAAATIGPAGGTLSSADGALVVEVPPGAFGEEHEVSIEEIANHAHGRVGRAWRILPEGLHTPVPMTLRMRYGAPELRGTTAALLGVATQAADGTWRVHRQPEHDAQAMTVAVRTRHFSDWSLVAGMQLLPGEAAVQPGATVDLRVLRCEYVDNAEDDDLHVPMPDDLRRCEVEPLANFSLEDWAVNGVAGGSEAVGTLEPADDPTLGTAVYTAPATAPARNPVAVSVRLPDPFAPGVQTLVSNITVADAGAACAHLRNRATWQASWGLRYAWNGANRDGDTLRTMVRADLTARLEVSAQGPGGMSWSGPATGTFEFDQEHVRQGAVPRVTTAAGAGAPYVAAHVPDGTNVTLSIDFRTCEYSTHVKVVGPVLLADRGEVESLPHVTFGYADASAPRAVPSSGTLSGGGAITAHSPLWALANPHADTWVPVAGDPFNSGFAAEGEAGAAAVEWVIEPVGD
jgi:hypothetical protein